MQMFILKSSLHIEERGSLISYIFRIYAVYIHLCTDMSKIDF